MAQKIIEDNNKIYAKIIKSSEIGGFDGFFTDEKDEIQFGILNFEKNFKTGAHYHNKPDTKTKPTDEVIIILSGSLRVDFYNIKGDYLKSVIVSKGDVVIFYEGAHNLLFNDDTKMFVFRTGARDEEFQDTRIIGINNSELAIDND